jgi:hypothetical protein
MFWLKKRRLADEKEEILEYSVPVISVTLEQVRKAVEEFEEHLPEGMNRTFLIRVNNEINFRLLIPYLKGLPDRPFFMSREAYEIYSEEDKRIPLWLDIVQRAVDNYIEEWKVPPLVPDDRNQKISVAILQKYYYLKDRPPMDFYLTPYGNLISHRPPSQQKK